jgi:hypothetical protein
MFGEVGLSMGLHTWEGAYNFDLKLLESLKESYLTMRLNTIQNNEN